MGCGNINVLEANINRNYHINVIVLTGHLLGALVMSTFGQAPWYQAQKDPSANFYEIKSTFESRADEREAPRQEELLRMFSVGGHYWELAEGDVQFKRWSHFVEPRVEAHGGDLSVFAISRSEKLKLYPLGGVPSGSRFGKWVPLGPKNTDWQAAPAKEKPTVGHQAGAGRINSITFHPTDDTKMMVGTPSGGLWFTEDEGRTWFTTTDQLPTLGATWAVYDPRDPDVIFLGTGEANSSGGDAPSIGLLKSIDGGKSWNPTGLTFDISDQTQISKVEIDLINPDKIIVGTTNGLYISNNAGVSFVNVNGIGGGTVWDIEIHPTNRNTIYVSTTRVYRSTNGGTSFSEVTSVPRNGNRTYLGVSQGTPNVVYALNSEAQSFTGIYRSSNSGQSFSRMGSGAAANCTQAWYDVSFAVSNTDPDELIVGCRNIYRSTNGGASLTQISTDVHVDQHNAHFRPSDDVLFVANDGGIYQNNGGSNWFDLNNDLEIRQLYRMGIHPNDYDQLCAGSQDNGTDLQSSVAAGFRRIITNDGFECFWNTTGTRLYGEEPRGVVYGCDYVDGIGEANCTELNIGASGNWDTDLAPHPTNPNTLYAGMSSNIYRSTNEGNNWSRLGNIGGTGTIRNFTLSSSDPNVIYVMKGTNVYRTGNSGSSWSDVWPGNQGTPIYAAVDGSDPDDVWVVVSGFTAGNKVFHSTNGGGNWINETSTGLPNLPATTVIVDDLDLNGPGIYVGMDAGVYYRNSTYTTWQNFSDGLPNVQITELEIGRKGSNNDRRLFVSTYGRGIWRSPLWDDILSVNKELDLPEIMDFHYSRVPGTNKIQIQIKLAKAYYGPISLFLNNARGQKVFHKNFRDSKSINEFIDIKQLNNGIYFLSLKMNNTVTTKAMVLH